MNADLRSVSYVPIAITGLHSYYFTFFFKRQCHRNFSFLFLMLFFFSFDNCCADKTYSDGVLRLCWPEIWRLLWRQQLAELAIMISRRFCSYCSWWFYGTRRALITPLLGSADIKLADMRLFSSRGKRSLFSRGFSSCAMTWSSPRLLFFYTPSYLSELQSFKLIISTDFPSILIFK